jgi:NAD(P)-dependent dehydrogenase (short-subunit alcohol dehydrogenase family)
MHMRVAVIDGQGGGIGKHLTTVFRRHFGDRLEIIALGTNSMATQAMLKAGANEGATGENAIIKNAAEVDAIVGTVAVLTADSMLGELTPGMAAAIGQSKAKKFLLPLNNAGVTIACVKEEPLPHQIEDLVRLFKEAWENV